MSVRAFVYTEVQVPFEDAPWREINAGLKTQSGQLSKTWLSGVNVNTLGRIHAFDTLENAAFCTRVFEASGVEEASRQMIRPPLTDLVSSSSPGSGGIRLMRGPSLRRICRYPEPVLRGAGTPPRREES